MLIFTNKGKLHWLKVYEIPEANRVAKGKAIVNLIKLAEDEKVTEFLAVKDFEEGKSILMITKKGIVKRTALNAFANPRSAGIFAISLDDDDELISAHLISKGEDIFISTSEGISIRFNGDKIRDMGRQARGVKGISLDAGDIVVAADIVTSEKTMLTVTENGYGKRTELDEYKSQGRAGKGIITIKTTERNGKVIGAVQVEDTNEIMIVTNIGKLIRMKVADISVIGRNTQGVRLVNVAGDEKVVDVSVISGEDPIE